MRKIKFRIFLKKEKKMFQLHTLFDFEIGTGFIFIDNNIAYCKTIDRGKTFSVIDYPDCELMQFTGLLDKNGKEIYEGDILNHGNYLNGSVNGKYIHNVEWGETGDSDGYNYEKHFEYVVGRNSLADVYKTSEIIGNIFSDPELLK
jgi:uncharacterized phage protein (TIGR01671 family)